MRHVAMIALAAACGKSADPPPGPVPAPAPPPREIIEPAAPELATPVLTEMTPHWSTSRRTLWLTDATHVCTFAPDAAGAPLAQLACTEVPSPDHEPPFGGAADGVPLPMMVDMSADEPEIDLRLGDRVIVREPYDIAAAYAWSRDAVDYAIGGANSYEFVRWRGAPDLVTRTSVAALADASHAVVLGAGVVYYVAPDGHLHAIVDRQPASPTWTTGTNTDLGPARELPPDPPACDSPRRHAIVVDHAIRIAVDGAWGPPSPLATNLAPLTCDDARGVTSVVRVGDAMLDRMQCDVACEHRRIALPSPFSAGDEGDLGDAIALAWDQDPRRDTHLRLRVAAPAAFATATDHVLSTVGAQTSLRIHAGTGAAILLLDRAEQHSWAYRIDARGAVAPVNAPALKP